MIIINIKEEDNEYPFNTEQLDKIYHSGVAGWKTEIKAIKDKIQRNRLCHI